MWQGWAVLLASIGVMAVAALLLMPAHVVAFLSVVLLTTLLLLLICRVKGEPPAWRWGK
jgi:hypothetical protein